MKISIVDPKDLYCGLNPGVGYVAAYLKKYNALDKIKALLIFAPPAIKSR